MPAKVKVRSAPGGGLSSRGRITPPWMAKETSTSRTGGGTDVGVGVSVGVGVGVGTGVSVGTTGEGVAVSAGVGEGAPSPPRQEARRTATTIGTRRRTPKTRAITIYNISEPGRIIVGSRSENGPDSRKGDRMAVTARLWFYICETKLGWIGVVLSPAGLKATTLFQPSRDEVLREVMELGAREATSEGEAGDLPQHLRAYAEGQPMRFQDTIDWSGVTPFQRRVLEETQAIPAGETRSYRWLAERVGKPAAARAVGRVMTTNPPTDSDSLPSGGGQRWLPARLRGRSGDEGEAAEAGRAAYVAAHPGRHWWPLYLGLA